MIELTGKAERNEFSGTVMNIFAKAAMVAIFSWVYTVFYDVSRQRDVHCGYKELFPKIIAVYCYNAVLLFILGKRSPVAFSLKHIFLLLLMLIADIDFFCKKIPTELLIGYAAVCFRDFFVAPVSAAFAGILILFLSLGILFYKKMGIGLYDILLLIFTGFTMRDTSLFLLLIAEFLILWGIAGLFLRSFFSKQSEEKVPLAPLIAFVFFLWL